MFDRETRRPKGFGFVTFMQRFARAIVWAIVIGIVGVCASLALFCLVKGKVIDLDAVANETSTYGMGAPSSAPQIPDDLDGGETNPGVFKNAGYALSLTTVLLAAGVIAMRRKIKIAISIIVEASKAVQAMPMMVL